MVEKNGAKNGQIFPQLMLFKMKMGFLREEKVERIQYTSRFAVIKMIVNRFYIAVDQKMM